ncbi:MAG: hypothetical protein DRH15_14725 [Deltaproteobacteria bacterium]|nr:MAG: hypothetical protein DRH15_14725 [Deltaproteobacteria bacterium]
MDLLGDLPGVGSMFSFLGKLFSGKAFLIAAFLPALVFVALNLLLVVPYLPSQVSTQVISFSLTLPLLEDVKIEGQGLFYTLAPVVIGAALILLNTPIIKLYEGAFSWQRNFLFKPLLEQVRRRHRAKHEKLRALQAEYNRVAAQLERGEGNPQALQFQLAALRSYVGEKPSASSIEGLYMDLFSPGGVGWEMPFDEARLMPTRLGNAFAVIEEYPYRRYGMDGVTFWPRLTHVISDDYKAVIDSAKTNLDSLLNFSLLSGVLGLEFLAMAGYTLANGHQIAAGWFCIGWIVTWIVAYLFYRATVSATQSMGMQIAACFDLFRGALLDKFHIKRPKDLLAEQAVWRGLAKFLVSGDAYYYPRSPEKDVKTKDK